MWPENPRKLRESSAKDPRKSWLAGMAPPPFYRGVAVPTEIWRLWCLAVPTEICGRSWGPAVPTEIWRSRLRSGSADWDLELAVGGGVEDEEVKEEEATRCNINPHVATAITAEKRCPLCLKIEGFNAHFTAENGEFVSHVFRESSRKWISDTWMPRKKNLHRERFAKKIWQTHIILLVTVYTY